MPRTQSERVFFLSFFAIWQKLQSRWYLTTTNSGLSNSFVCQNLSHFVKGSSSTHSLIFQKKVKAVKYIIAHCKKQAKKDTDSLGSYHEETQWSWPREQFFLHQRACIIYINARPKPSTFSKVSFNHHMDNSQQCANHCYHFVFTYKLFWEHLF